MLPNAALKQSDLPKYAVLVSDITKETGINFSPALPYEFLTGKSVSPKLDEWPKL